MNEIDATAAPLLSQRSMRSLGAGAGLCALGAKNRRESSVQMLGSQNPKNKPWLKPPRVVPGQRAFSQNHAATGATGRRCRMNACCVCVTRMHVRMHVR